jgi:hypothetical protein
VMESRACDEEGFHGARHRHWRVQFLVGFLDLYRDGRRRRLLRTRLTGLMPASLTADLPVALPAAVTSDLDVCDSKSGFLLPTDGWDSVRDGDARAVVNNQAL